MQIKGIMEHETLKKVLNIILDKKVDIVGLFRTDTLNDYNNYYAILGHKKLNEEEYDLIMGVVNEYRR